MTIPVGRAESARVILVGRQAADFNVGLFANLAACAAFWVLVALAVYSLILAAFPSRCHCSPPRARPAFLTARFLFRTRAALRPSAFDFAARCIACSDPQGVRTNSLLRSGRG